MELNSLVKNVQQGINEAENMERLYNQLYLLILKVINRYKGYAELDDLKQEAYMALYNAVQGYDENIATFITFYVKCLKAHIVRYIDNSSCLVRLPEWRMAQIRQYKLYIREYTAIYGNKPTKAQIRAYMRLNKEAFEELEKAIIFMDIDRLEQELDPDNGEATLADTIPSGEDISEDCIDKVMQQELKSDLWESVNSLPKEEALTIKEYYREGQTLYQIAEALNVDYSKIRLYRDRAIRSLKRDKYKLRGYYEAIYGAYHGGGVERFNRTWTSSTEYAALKLYEA